LVDHPQAAQRILLLTRQEEKRLLERLENLKDLEDLQRLQQRLYENLGIRVHIAPGYNEVRTMRGIVIELDDQPGLCRKTRQSIPAAIRRGLERNPQVAFRLLDTHDLLRDA
jgi:CRP-like cAMP-binding protein